MTDYTPKRISDEGDEIISATIHVRRSVWKKFKLYCTDKDLAFGAAAGGAIAEYLEKRGIQTSEETAEESTFDNRQSRAGGDNR